ncbi:YeaC family protein [Photobacterium lucens]|uniref:YeaC family protein n=1 Tax=Photobacterium lucens TaxID=2562949 RepID=UPI0013695369|nr:DUF1315 family protein [Photobacterium lucens]MBP2698905.1 DUF1315 family protein [Vibrio parahaemolyticus]MZG58397.1 DUF1315 family protein [Photobacterium lucens]MZG82127.1 DUF1315 family protein [Photobacterium lucens]
MDVSKLLAAMTPEVYERMSFAVETGKWPDGTPLTSAQRDSAMQAVMLYQSRYNTEAQHMTVAAGGEIKFKTKAEFKREFVTTQGDELAPSSDIARFEHDDL